MNCNSHSVGDSTGCGTGCILGIVLPWTICSFVLCLLCCVRQRRCLANDKNRRLTESQTRVPAPPAKDRLQLYLSTDGQPSHQQQLHVHAHTSYDDSRGQWTDAPVPVQLIIDNEARTVWGSGSDEWGSFQLTGQFMIASHTTGWIGHRQSYDDGCRSLHSGRFDSSEPQSVTGCWLTNRSDDCDSRDIRRFTFRFAQSLRIVDVGQLEGHTIDISDAAGADGAGAEGVPRGEPHP